MEMREAADRLKTTASHVVSTTREVGESPDHELRRMPTKFGLSRLPPSSEFRPPASGRTIKLRQMACDVACVKFAQGVSHARHVSTIAHTGARRSAYVLRQQ